MNDVESLELKISKFLRFGVVFSGTLILIGWVKIFTWSGNPFYVFDLYDPLKFMDLFYFYLERGRWGHLCIYAGLAALISLPIIRVLLTALLFLKRREFILAGVAFFVLCVLGFSFLLGIEI